MDTKNSLTDLKGSQSPFHILYENGSLRLTECCLPQPRTNYIKSYLEQVNRYRAIGFHEGSPVFSIYQPPLATNAGMRSLTFRVQRRFDGIRLPATATIAVNKACQCDCAHCSAIFYNTSPKKELFTPILQQALQETSQLGATNLILLGGEPLLKKDLCEIIASVDKNLSTVTLFTNGEYLTPQTCQNLKKAGLMGAFVSIDDADPEMHDSLRRRPGLFSKAMAGIKNLQEAGILVALSSYLSPQRLAENGFEAIVELGREMAVNEITFFDAIPSGQWLRDTSCLLRGSDRQLILEKVRGTRKRSGYPGLSVQSTMTSECGSAFCFAANTQFYLTAFGEMCPCDFTPLTIGTYPESPIAELWEKMIHISPYDQRAKSCRMQDNRFRKEFIEKIPDKGPYPYPLQRLAYNRSH